MASAVAPIICTLNFSSVPAHGGQEGVGLFPLDDLGDDFGGNRLNIGGVGEVGVGHDRRRVGIHQHYPVALLLQRLACLRARIVELTGLTDDDRAGADDQDRFDVGAFGHRLTIGTKKGRAYARSPGPR
jgi:hypothetical protein